MKATMSVLEDPFEYNQVGPYNIKKNPSQLI